MFKTIKTLKPSKLNVSRLFKLTHNNSHSRTSNVVSAGFTILETLIVLAIAGLILLIVLEAIPALERNSRNNERKQDVSTILGAVSHYELNNSGDFPGSSSNFLQYDVNQLSYYNGSLVQYDPGSPPTSGIAVYQGNATDGVVSRSPNNQLDAIYIYNYQRCDSNASGGSSNEAAGYGDVVALYALENGSTPEPECKQL